MAFVVVAAIFLRWLPQHGPSVLALFGLATLTAGAIYLTHRLRYAHSTRNIAESSSSVEVVAILATGLAVIVLSFLGIFFVLVLP